MSLFLNSSTEMYDLGIFLIAIIMLPQNGFYWKKKKKKEGNEQKNVDGNF